jgi:hypothetical protein
MINHEFDSEGRCKTCRADERLLHLKRMSKNFQRVLAERDKLKHDLERAIADGDEWRQRATTYNEPLYERLKAERNAARNEVECLKVELADMRNPNPATVKDREVLAAFARHINRALGIQS